MYKPTKELVDSAKKFLSTGSRSIIHKMLYYDEFDKYDGCGAQRYVEATKTENKEIKECIKKCGHCKDCYTAIAKDILSKYHPKIKVV